MGERRFTSYTADQHGLGPAPDAAVLIIQEIQVLKVVFFKMIQN
jgi:hypothetical protein